MRKIISVISVTVLLTLALASHSAPAAATTSAGGEPQVLMCKGMGASCGTGSECCSKYCCNKHGNHCVSQSASQSLCCTG